MVLDKACVILLLDLNIINGLLFMDFHNFLSVHELLVASAKSNFLILF